MLEFTEVFTLGQCVDRYSIYTIIKCKNIDFSHVAWIFDIFDDEQAIYHITDNIIDINAAEYDIPGYPSYTLLEYIIRNTTSCNITVGNRQALYYLLNNGCINNDTFTFYNDDKYNDDEYNDGHLTLSKYKYLVKYLTDTSLGKFKGYYNIKRYYDMVTTMLLILKAQQWLPSTIIKYLIIPFIYQ